MVEPLSYGKKDMGEIDKVKGRQRGGGRGTAKSTIRWASMFLRSGRRGKGGEGFGEK